LITHDYYNRPTHSQYRFFRLLSAIWNVFRLGFAAFQSDVSPWSSEQSIGLPNYAGLLEGLHQCHWETKEGAEFVQDMNRIHPDTDVMDVEQRVVELKPTLPFAPKECGDIRLPTAQEMSERYRVASGQSRLRPKEMQN
jgi:hypothetical protein